MKSYRLFPYHNQCSRYEFASIAKQHKAENGRIEFRVLFGRRPIHHLLPGIGADQRCGQHRHGYAHKIENSQRCDDWRQRQASAECVH